ncbi:hypothetical protein C1S70_12175 [Azospirillum argentinense]|uniref:Uncharacterized protein n=1 Tax=Azospirillum argentinense TaxID=2970906 RepID=A0A2K1G1A4_9PROT|nr:hypothetical protein C1S70_12175 [Azospirillum argentinense]
MGRSHVAALSPLPSGERVARRAGEGGARDGTSGQSASPSPQPSPRRGEGNCHAARKRSWYSLRMETYQASWIGHHHSFCSASPG